MKKHNRSTITDSAEIVIVEYFLSKSRSFVTAIRERVTASGKVRLGTVSLLRKYEGGHKDQDRAVKRVTVAGLEISFPYQEFHKGGVKGNRKVVELACELDPDKQEKPRIPKTDPGQVDR